MPNQRTDFENRIFTSGKMNLDASPEFVEQGEYGIAFNVSPHNSESGSVGTITNIGGNTPVEYDF